jgi:hypothetical protein
VVELMFRTCLAVSKRLMQPTTCRSVNIPSTIVDMSRTGRRLSMSVVVSCLRCLVDEEPWLFRPLYVDTCRRTSRQQLLVLAPQATPLPPVLSVARQEMRLGKGARLCDANMIRGRT